MEEQETYSGIRPQCYLIPKEDFESGAPLEETGSAGDFVFCRATGAHHKKHIAPSCNPLGFIVPQPDGTYTLIGEGSTIGIEGNPKTELNVNYIQSFTATGELELSDEAQHSLFCADDADSQHIKADVEFETEEGKRYFVKDANIEINVCPLLPHHKPLLIDKLSCDMVTPLCYPLRWADKHFNRRIAHYQWMKQHNYL